MKILKYTLLCIISCFFIVCINYYYNILPTKENMTNTTAIIDDISIVGEQVSAQERTRTNIQLLARAINGEARGEPYIGQVAVGAVILNRVRHPSFPNSISGVIYQPGAFTAVSDGQINASLSTSSPAYKAANDCINGWDPSGGAIYYYNPAKTTNKWIWSRPVIKVIGKHRFAK